jgi:hypothetical protein
MIRQYTQSWHGTDVAAVNMRDVLLWTHINAELVSGLWDVQCPSVILWRSYNELSPCLTEKLQSAVSI